MAFHRLASRKRCAAPSGAGAAAALTAALLPGQAASAAPGAACDSRANNTYQKLLDCVTLEGVREHLEAFQKIADNSTDPVYPGTRAAGTDGYADSVEYVAGLLREAGYEVTLDPVEITFNFPAVLRQLTPVAAEYETGVFTGSGSGEVEGNVIPVDINLDAGTGHPPAAARRPTSPASTGAVTTTSRWSSAARASSGPRRTTPSRPAPRRSSSSTRATRRIARP